jgi:uncharacterized protein (DUF2336 family)
MSSPALSKASINALLQMAVDRSSSGRGALVRSVANICLAQNHNLSKKEVQLTFEILHMLIRDVEMGVRRDLAQQLAPRRAVLRDLIVTLANDQIDVAYPVLVESVVLTDDDLIAIIGDRPDKHQIAVSLRKPLSAAVSEALVDTKNLDVINSLTRNPSAALSDPVMRRLVDMSEAFPPLCRPLLHRPDLIPEMAWRMNPWVDDWLKDFIAEKFPARAEAERAPESEVERAPDSDVERAPDSDAERTPDSDAEPAPESDAEFVIKFDGEIDPKIDDAIRDALRIADANSPHDLWERVECISSDLI